MREYVRRRKTALRQIIFRFFNYQIQFLILDMVLHELGHVFAALAVGVSLSEIGIGRNGFSPVVYVTQSLPDSSKTIIGYAGGLLPAVLVSVAFLLLWLRKRQFNQTVADWTLGAALISRIVLSMFGAVFEGSSPPAYSAASLAVMSPISILLNVAISLMLLRSSSSASLRS